MLPNIFLFLIKSATGGHAGGGVSGNGTILDTSWTAASTALANELVHHSGISFSSRARQHNGSDVALVRHNLESQLERVLAETASRSHSQHHSGVVDVRRVIRRDVESDLLESQLVSTRGDTGLGGPLDPPVPKIRKYYRFDLLPWIKRGRSAVKITFDRLALQSVLDRSISPLENIVSVILAILVAIFAALVLNEGYYQDLLIFLFCAVTAGCQYSLLKSVQPDSASPTHGFNRVIVYSRATYFIICCALALILDRISKDKSNLDTFRLWGATFPKEEHLHLARDGSYIFILFFPLIFMLGLLPQINTFCMYILEQVRLFHTNNRKC